MAKDPSQMGNQMQVGNNLAQQLMAQRPMGNPAPGGAAGGMPPGGMPGRTAAMQAHFNAGNAAGQNMDWMKQQNPNMQFGGGPQGPPQIPGMASPNLAQALAAMQQRQQGQNPGAITANRPMNTGVMGGMPMRQPGGANYMSNAIQRQGGNPAMQNTVTNKLRPTMASNQNVQPLQSSNPNQSPRPFPGMNSFRGFNG